MKWVQEDGTVVAVCENFAEDLFCEVFDPGSGYEKVQPWMRNFPQAFGPQLHLGDVHPVQELQVGDLRLEEGGRYVPQSRQKRFDSLRSQAQVTARSWPADNALQGCGPGMITWCMTSASSRLKFLVISRQKRILPSESNRLA